MGMDEYYAYISNYNKEEVLVKDLKTTLIKNKKTTYFKDEEEEIDNENVNQI